MRSAIGSVVVLLLLGATPAWAVGFQPDAPGVNGFTTVDKITWKDAKGLDREFYFAKVFPNALVPGIKGYVTRLTWQPDPSKARIIAEEDPSGINASNAQGWGTNVMHMHYLEYGGSNPVFGGGLSATTNKRDGFDFHQGALLLGAHHLIYRVTYKQYTTLQKATPDDRKWVQVTTDWFIADGLDHVIFAHTLDASAGIASDPVRFLNNTLAPYSLVSSASWKGTTDWAGGTDAPDGQSFGDFKRFVTNDMRNWTYGGTNTIPFVWEWVTPLSGRGDAESALVQTETYAQKNAGEGFAGGRDASGTHLPVYPDLNGQEYAYQLNFFDAYGSKRMTWGTQFGALYGGFGSTRGYQNYSLAMSMGKYSDHGASELIKETESIHDGTLRVQALTGALVTSGNEGSGNPTSHVYSPAGYNHVYRTWEGRAAANVLRLRFDLSTGTYKRPTLVVRGFTATTATVTLNGAPAAASTTLDDAGDVLWVTLLTTLSGSNVLEIVGAGACVPSCGLDRCGTDGCGGTCTCGTGAVCLTNLTCCRPNTNTCGPDGCGGNRAPCTTCTPSCAPGSCGSNGCGGTCACTTGAVCLASGACCTPNTNVCGPDGCGGTRGWDPQFGTYSSSQTTTKVQFSVHDTTVATLALEVGGTAPRTINLATRTVLSGGYLRFSTTTSPGVAAGTSVRLKATQAAASGGRTATSTWFGYMQGTPVLDCAPAACVPSCLPNTCGSNGCGGTCGCAIGALCQAANLTCCQPNTNTCGPDGCGGTHGACPVTCTVGDADGDGVCDDHDNCTGCWNADQADADRDGLGDCWRCDWCTGPGTDTDWDGVCDGVDNCPTVWNQSQADRDHDGIGDACDPTP